MSVAMIVNPVGYIVLQLKIFAVYFKYILAYLDHDCSYYRSSVVVLATGIEALLKMF